jgi:16S rRNA (cytidine1402-2'-O)-methyltransferase
VPAASVLPARTIDVARNLTHWVVETPTAARAFLKSIVVQRPIADLSMSALSKAPVAGETDRALAALRGGHDVGLLSDAGCPGVADPGAVMVAAAHAANVRVVPLVGPSAVLLALMASGMNGQQFAFHGYLPVKPGARADALRALEQRSHAEASTALFIETPYRNAALWQAMLQALQANTRIAISSGITLDASVSRSHTVARWREQPAPVANDTPAVFAIGR